MPLWHWKAEDETGIRAAPSDLRESAAQQGIRKGLFGFFCEIGLRDLYLEAFSMHMGLFLTLLALKQENRWLMTPLFSWPGRP